MNVPFQEIEEAGKIWLFGAELNMDNAVVGFMVNKARMQKNIPVSLYTALPESAMEHKMDEVKRIKSYYHFVRAVNYYLVTNELTNMMYVNDRTLGFQEYSESLMKEDYHKLLEDSGMDQQSLEAFAEDFNRENNAILITEEKQVPSPAVAELRNLMLITGKLGKTAMGMICLKEKNNSQGLLDMGIGHDFGVGTLPMGKNQIIIDKMESLWKVNNLPEEVPQSPEQQLENGKLKNLFIFGEDPVGCAREKDKIKPWLKQVDFTVVQDYFITETAREADLIMPAGFPHETGGSYTNAEKKIQTFEKAELFPAKVSHDNIKQLMELHKKFGLNSLDDVHDVFMEAVSLLPTSEEARDIPFIPADAQSHESLFDYGCDHLVMRFETESEEKLSKNPKSHSYAGIQID
jgi:formate dehydrogenase major subunit